VTRDATEFLMKRICLSLLIVAVTGTAHAQKLGDVEVVP
jgi:hypothetical protein